MWGSHLWIPGDAYSFIKKIKNSWAKLKYSKAKQVLGFRLKRGFSIETKSDPRHWRQMKANLNAGYLSLVDFCLLWFPGSSPGSKGHNIAAEVSLQVLEQTLQPHNLALCFLGA